MSKYVDIWHDDVATPADTGPLAILEEQAKNLTRRTDGVVEGEALTLAQSPDGRKRVAFFVNAPAIDYSYKLLELSYDPSDQYPVNIAFYDENHVANNEVELLSKLGLLLNDDRSKRVIRELLLTGTSGRPAS